MKIGLGVKIGGLKFGGNFDPDAAAYFERAGVTDQDGKILVDAFVRGIKDLGLWSSMVSWPLRSSQNAGTGTTAYSLGGLGTFNGTLTNGPTWGSDGFDLDIDQRITTSASANQPDTIFSVQKLRNEATAQIVYDGSTRQHLYKSLDATPLYGFAGNAVAVLDPFTADQFFSTQLEFNGSSGSSSINGQTKTTRNFGSNNLTQLRIGTGNNFQKGAIISFIAVISAGSITLLHNLYKSTLGQGLGLP